MQKVLITGITGFVGSHLSEHLLDLKEYEIYGLERPDSNTQNISHIYQKLKISKADMTDYNSLLAVIKKIKPDVVFHLAAKSFVFTSWKQPSQTLHNNIISTANLLEAIRSINIDPAILIAGSSEEYGLVSPEENPVTEKNHLRPFNPYGISKVATDFLAIQYYRNYGMKAIVTRAFNHTGPRQADMYVCSSLAKQIAEKNPILSVGNLEAKRDFTDVRDIVRAYVLAINKCRAGEQYNLCSGKSWKIKDIVDLLIKISNKNIEIKVDPTRLRPSDVPILEGSYSKFNEATGWNPKIKFEDTLRDLLTYWECGGKWPV